MSLNRRVRKLEASAGSGCSTIERDAAEFVRRMNKLAAHVHETCSPEEIAAMQEEYTLADIRKFLTAPDGHDTKR